MQKLLIATTNRGKLDEISGLLANLPVKLVSLSDVGIQDDVEETGKTFLENSLIKANFYAKKSNLPSISDDGGLMINALNGAPGVKSRRWLGYSATDDELIDHMEKIAGQLPDNNRTAYFKTVITLALPDGRVWSKSGEVKGIIAKQPHLKKVPGLPYRSFFFLPQLNKFYFETELSDKEKKQFNHRYKAIEKLKPILKKELHL